MYMWQSLWQSSKILEKEKYIPNTTGCLTVFMRAFYTMCVENFLKGPGMVLTAYKLYDLFFCIL